MVDITRIGIDIANLTTRDLADFRAWFSAFDATAWDRQLESDLTTGALDALADQALSQHRAGHSRPR